MALSLSPLQPSEIPSFLRIHWEAFLPLSADMIYPMIYPNGLQPDLMARMENRLVVNTKGDPGAYCSCAKDASTGDILGVAWWDTIHHPPRTREEVDAAFARASKTRSTGSVEGMNRDLDRAFFHCSFYGEMEIMAAGYQAYMTLRTLAVDPKYQRRGAGSFLLEAGLQEADRLALPVYLDAGVSARGLYERFGFEVVRDFPLDCRDYGGRSPGRHWSMVRPARTSSAEAA